MKTYETALGVDCDFCHDPDDRAKSTKHKEEARDMIRMTKSLNARYFQGKKKQLTCVTCHNGKEYPPQ